MNNERDCSDKHLYRIDGKKVLVYFGSESDKLVVYLNTFSEEGNQVYKTLYENNCPDFTLAAISGLNWNHDIELWAIPPILAEMNHDRIHHNSG